jgi:hypothetical protein
MLLHIDRQAHNKIGFKGLDSMHSRGRVSSTFSTKQTCEIGVARIVAKGVQDLESRSYLAS